MKASALGSARTKAAVYDSLGTKNGPPVALALRFVSVMMSVALGAASSGVAKPPQTMTAPVTRRRVEMVDVVMGIPPTIKMRENRARRQEVKTLGRGVIFPQPGPRPGKVALGDSDPLSQDDPLLVYAQLVMGVSAANVAGGRRGSAR